MTEQEDERHDRVVVAVLSCSDERQVYEVLMHARARHGKVLFLPVLGGVKRFLDFPGSLAKHPYFMELKEHGVLEMAAYGHQGCRKYVDWLDKDPEHQRIFHEAELQAFTRRARKDVPWLKIVGLGYAKLLVPDFEDAGDVITVEIPPE